MAKISVQLTGIKQLQQAIERKKDLTPVKMVVAKHGALAPEENHF